MTAYNTIYLIGYRCFSDLYCVDAKIWIPFLQTNTRIEFVVDTGSVYTTISYKDAKKLGIDQITVETEDMATIDGVADNVRLNKKSR